MFDTYRTTRRRPPRWLDDVYRRPDPFRSLEEWQRLNHLDLADMSHAELRRDLGALRMRLHVDPMPDPWLLERHAALCTEIGRRTRSRPAGAA